MKIFTKTVSVSFVLLILSFVQHGFSQCGTETLTPYLWCENGFARWAITEPDANSSYVWYDRVDDLATASTFPNGLINEPGIITYDTISGNEYVFLETRLEEAVLMGTELELTYVKLLNETVNEFTTVSPTLTPVALGTNFEVDFQANVDLTLTSVKVPMRITDRSLTYKIQLESGANSGPVYEFNTGDADLVSGEDYLVNVPFEVFLTAGNHRITVNTNPGGSTANQVDQLLVSNSQIAPSAGDNITFGANAAATSGGTFTALYDFRSYTACAPQYSGPSIKTTLNCCTPPSNINTFTMGGTRSFIQASGDSENLTASFEAGSYYAWYENGSFRADLSGVDQNVIMITEPGSWEVREITDPSRTATDLDNPSCYAVGSTLISEQFIDITEVSSPSGALCAGEAVYEFSTSGGLFVPDWSSVLGDVVIDPSGNSLTYTSNAIGSGSVSVSGTVDGRTQTLTLPTGPFKDCSGIEAMSSQCNGDSRTLTATISGGDAVFVGWEDNDGNSLSTDNPYAVTPVQTTRYTAVAKTPSANVLGNGSFASPISTATDVISGGIYFDYITGDIGGSGGTDVFTISSNTVSGNGGAWDDLGPRPGSTDNNMLVADIKDVKFITGWEFTVASAGTEYLFDGWLANQHSQVTQNFIDPAHIGIFITDANQAPANGDLLISEINTEIPANRNNDWQNLSGNWEATSAGTYTLYVKDLRTTNVAGQLGNDIVLDDFSLRELDPNSEIRSSVTVESCICDPIDTVFATYCGDSATFEYVDKNNAPGGTYDWYGSSAGGSALNGVNTGAYPSRGFKTAIALTEGPVGLDEVLTVYLEDETVQQTKIQENLPASCSFLDNQGDAGRYAHKITVYDDVTISSFKIFARGDQSGLTNGEFDFVVYPPREFSNQPNTDSPLQTQNVNVTFNTPDRNGPFIEIDVDISINLAGDPAGTIYWIGVDRSSVQDMDLAALDCNGTFPILDSDGGRFAELTEVLKDNGPNPSRGAFFDLTFSKTANQACPRVPVSVRKECPPCNKPALVNAGTNTSACSESDLSLGQGIYDDSGNFVENGSMYYVWYRNGTTPATGDYVALPSATGSGISVPAELVEGINSDVTYTLRVQDGNDPNNSECYTEDQVTISVLDTTIAILPVSIDDFCQENLATASVEVSLTGGIGPFEVYYSYNDGSTIVNDTLVISAGNSMGNLENTNSTNDSLGVGTYTITGTKTNVGSAIECQAEVTDVIEVELHPNLQITDSMVTCVGGTSTDATINVTLANGVPDYLVNLEEPSLVGSNTFNATTGVYSALFNANGVTNYRFAFGDQTGCLANQDTVQSTINCDCPITGVLALRSSASDTSICPSSNAVLVLTANGLTSALESYDFSVSNGKGTNFTPADFTETAPNSGIFELAVLDSATYTLENIEQVGLCLGTASGVVEVALNDSVNFTTPEGTSTELCPGANINLSVNITGTPSSIVWERNGIPIAGQTTNSFTNDLESDALNGGEYEVTVSGDCNAETLLVDSIKVTPLEVEIIGPLNADSVDTGVPFVDLDAEGNETGFTWSIVSGQGDLFDENLQQAELRNLIVNEDDSSPDGVGTTVVRVTLSDAAGICDEATDEITIIKLGFTPPFVPDAQLCITELPYTVLGNDVIPGIETPEIIDISGITGQNNYPNSSSTNPIELANVAFSPSNPDSVQYPFRYEIFNANTGITLDSSGTVTIYQEVMTSLAGNDTITCLENLQLNASEPSIGNGRWTCDAPNIIISNDNQTDAIISGLSSGQVVNCTWEVTNGTCSPSLDVVKIERKAPTTEAVISLNGNSTLDTAFICETDLVSLMGATPLVGPNSLSPYESGEWTTVSGISVGTVSGDNPGPQTPLVDGIGATTYEWEITSSVAGCDPDRDRLTIVVVTTPDPQITMPNLDSTICEDESLDIIANDLSIQSRDGVTYSWLIDGVPVNIGDTLVFNDTKTNGIYQVSADNGVCAIVRSPAFNLNVLDKPVVIPDVSGAAVLTVFQGDTLTLNGFTNGDAVQWISNSIDTLIIPVADTAVTKAFAAQGGIVSATLVAQNAACTNSASIVIQIRIPIQAPNVFTPNGDGQNEEFVIEGIETYPEASVRIFNRWGTLVYQTEDYDSNKWGGSGVPDGVYYYIIDLGLEDGSAHSGVIHILR